MNLRLVTSPRGDEILLAPPFVRIGGGGGDLVVVLESRVVGVADLAGADVHGALVSVVNISAHTATWGFTGLTLVVCVEEGTVTLHCIFWSFALRRG